MKRAGLAGLGLLFLLLSCSQPSQAPKAEGGGVAGSVEEGTYKIFVRHSGKALQGRSRREPVIQQADGGSNQLWVLRRASPGYFNILLKDTELSMDVAGYSSENGARVQLWDRHGGQNQEFSIQSLGGEWSKIVARHSGKVLDISGYSTADGADLQQWQDLGGQNQQFKLVRADTPPPGITPQPGGAVPNARPTVVITAKRTIEQAGRWIDGVRARMTDINGTDYDEAAYGGIEWVSFDPSVVQVVPAANVPDRSLALVKILQSRKGAVVMARMRDAPSIQSDPIYFADVEFQPYVGTTNFSWDVAYPPQNSQLYEPSLPPPLNGQNLGPFSPQEIADDHRIEANGTISFPVVFSTPYEFREGQKIASVGTQGFAGRITDVVYRGGWVKFRLIPLPASEIIRNVSFSRNEQVVNDWFNSSTRIGGVSSTSTRGGVSAQAVLVDNEVVKCESVASSAVLDVNPLKFSYSAVPIGVFTPRVVNGVADTDVEIGMKTNFNFSPTIRLAASIGEEIKCEAKQPVATANLPLTGPFAAFLATAKVEFKPFIGVSVAATGPSATLEFILRGKPEASCKFSFGDSGFEGKGCTGDLGDPKTETRLTVLSSPGVAVLSAKLNGGLGGKGGIQLGGFLGSRLLDAIRRLPPNSAMNRVYEVANAITFWDVVKADVGPAVKMDWANLNAVEAAKRNLSSIKLVGEGNVGFESSQLELLVAGLKKMGFNLSKLVTTRAWTVTQEYGTLFSPLKVDRITVDQAPTTSIVFKKGQPIDLDVKLAQEASNLVFESEAMAAILVVQDGGYTVMQRNLAKKAKNTFGGKAQIDNNLCDFLKTPKQGYIRGISQALGTVPTFSYAGSVTVSCVEDEPPPTDNLDFCAIAPPTEPERNRLRDSGDDFPPPAPPRGPIECRFPYPVKMHYEIATKNNTNFQPPWRWPKPYGLATIPANAVIRFDPEFVDDAVTVNHEVLVNPVAGGGGGIGVGQQRRICTATESTVGRAWKIYVDNVRLEGYVEYGREFGASVGRRHISIGSTINQTVTDCYTFVNDWLVGYWWFQRVP